MELYESEIKTLKLTTNVTTEITEIRTVKIKIINGTRLKIENVLYVPNVRFNLFYLYYINLYYYLIKTITEKGFKVIFTRNKAFQEKPIEKIIAH